MDERRGEHSEWEDSGSAPLDDADTVAFAPKRSRHLPTWRGWYSVVLAFLVGIGVGAGVVYQLRPGHEPPAAQPIPTTTTVVPEPVESPSVAPVSPMPSAEAARPKGTYQATCGRQTAGRTGRGVRGPRFTASVLFANSGNVGLSYRVEAVWYLPDGNDVTRSVRRDVPPGMTMRANVTAPAPAADTGPHTRDPVLACTTEVTLLGTFGSSYR